MPLALHVAFEDEYAANGASAYGKEQASAGNFVQQQTQEHAHCKEECPNPPYPHSVKDGADLTAIAVDIVDPGTVLFSRTLSLQPLAFDRVQLSQQFILKAFLGHSIRAPLETNVPKEVASALRDFNRYASPDANNFNHA
ncbi:hypothetical protein G6N76_07275 [Rhizobium daejeonense]|uniref:Uncharacterized protein n=1 Tax=Rhizobium daejeonense TaxID=240521 RepID=A0A6M1RZS3_9HYPH|nr:hypothetical protein [Rhizobium daejeonense]NGO63471.1 hypothetical protein [Rhizobium daejeonense]